MLFQAAKSENDLDFIVFCALIFPKTKLTSSIYLKKIQCHFSGENLTNPEKRRSFLESVPEFFPDQLQIFGQPTRVGQCCCQRSQLKKYKIKYDPMQ